MNESVKSSTESVAKFTKKFAVLERRRFSTNLIIIRYFPNSLRILWKLNNRKW
jgi:hypothetical protein